MIKYIYAFAIILLVLGMYYVLSKLVGNAKKNKVKTMQMILRPPKKRKDEFYLKTIDFFAVPLARIFPFSKSQLKKMQLSLDSAKIKISARLYLSRCMINSLVLFLVALASSIIIKPMILVAFFIPLLIYISETKKATKITSAYRATIESELPNFVASIATQLTSNRDIIRMMTEYSKTANDNFKHELEITVADMESGNYEIALNRFGGRINSTMLNNVIIGLVGVVRGNDEVTHFKLVGYDFKQLEIANMKKLTQRIIPKINACTMILLVAIIGLLSGVLILDMLEGAEVFF